MLIESEKNMSPISQENTLICHFNLITETEWHARISWDFFMCVCCYSGGGEEKKKLTTSLWHGAQNNPTSVLH